MIRSFIFCSALVAGSGAGAVALSVMHDSAFNVEMGALAEPEDSSAFVIPAFAPVRYISDAKPAALNSIFVPILTPPSEQPLDEVFLTPISSSPNNIEIIAPASEPAVAAVRPQPKVADVKPQERIVPVQKRFLAPKIVPQVTRSFTDPVVRTTAVAPKYIIGVYR